MDCQIMEIIYREKNKEIFLQRWQEYIDNNLNCVRYILLYVEYFLLYAENLILDKSFIIIENNKAVGICFCPIEKTNNISTISISGGYVMAPLSINKRIQKKIF